MGKECWTTLGLNRKQICFLEGISKKAKFSGGRKLSRTSIIRAFLSVAKKLDINVTGARDEKMLRDRISESFKRC